MAMHSWTPEIHRPSSKWFIFQHVLIPLLTVHPGGLRRRYQELDPIETKVAIETNLKFLLRTR
jgi:hypothetical protein